MPIDRRALLQDIASVGLLAAGGRRAVAGTDDQAASIEPYDLRCVSLPDPTGVEDAAPRLSWRCRFTGAGQRNARQTAYRIEVTAESGAPIWDSGRVVGADGVLVPYAGPSLRSGGGYRWRVTVWDEQGRHAPPASAQWRMGVLTQDEWRAPWIAATDKPPPLPPLDAAWIGYDPDTANGPGHALDDPGHTQYFRLALPLAEAVGPAGATLFLAADSLATVFVNGAYVATPPPDDTSPAVAMRLKLPALPAGRAVLAIQVGHKPGVRRTPALAARLVAYGVDGGTITAVSDRRWRVSDWAPDGWRLPDFDDRAWSPAKVLAPAGAPPWGPVSADLPQPAPAVYLRTEFRPRAAVRQAGLHASGLGWSEFTVNGGRVGDAMLSPALTDYRRRVPYVSHDVTALLRPGANAIGAVLGRGRFSAPRPDAVDFGTPRLRLQLVLDLADGTQQLVASGPDWQVSEDGPIRANNEYDGETYDPAHDLGDWRMPGFTAAGWQHAVVVDGPGGIMATPGCMPTRVLQERPPSTVKRLPPAPDGQPRWLFDFGQNLAGSCRVRLPPGHAAGQIRLRHAERLRADGMLDVANLRSARATDIYRTAGHNPVDWQPRFTTHGFRFVELTGVAEAAPDMVTACVIGDDLRPAGQFRCSDPMFNAVIAAAGNSVRSNCRSIRTDCPQRDERQGWLGDPAEDCRGEAFLFDNAAFYAKWAQDIVDTQRPDGSFADVAPAYWPIYPGDVCWPTALPAILDMLHVHHGDPAPIARHYPALAAWLDAMLDRVQSGVLQQDRWGDWGAPAGGTTPGPLIATAYLVHCLDLAQRFAALLSRDASRFATAAATLRAGFHARFHDGPTGLYGASVTGSILAFAFGLVPGPQQDAAGRRLIDCIEQTHGAHPCYGLVGCQWVNRVLTGLGRADLAFRLATQPTAPSLGYMVASGATTLWELWDGDTADPAMSSLNHTMLMGDLLQYAFATLAGLQPSAPGFRRMRIAPQFIPQLTWVEAEHVGPTGLIRLRWDREPGGVRMAVEIPPGTVAALHLPPGASDLRERGREALHAPGITGNAQDGYELGSGRYELTASI
jgi:alpha-L-rhamnosidase